MSDEEIDFLRNIDKQMDYDELPDIDEEEDSKDHVTSKPGSSVNSSGRNTPVPR